MAKRAANRDGCIEQIHVGKYTYWRYRWTDASGKRRCSPNFKLQSEAVAYKRQLLGEIASGTYVPPDRMRFDTWADAWFSSCRQNCAPTTRTGNESVMRLYLLPTFGRYKIQDITLPLYQQWLNSLPRRTYEGTHAPASPSRIIEIHRIMCMILDYARKCGIIAVNPCRGADLPTVKQSKGTRFSESELAAFLREIKNTRFESLYLFILGTGVRLGEALGVEWRHFNRDTGTITIEQQLRVKAYGMEAPEIADTKTGLSRSIGIGQDTINLLKSIRKQQLASGIRSKFIFCDEAGNTLKHRTVQQNFNSVMKRLGLTHTPHSLRHTYASLLCDAGINLKVIQEQLGHTSIKTTGDVYIAMSLETKKEAASVLESSLCNIRQDR